MIKTRLIYKLAFLVAVSVVGLCATGVFAYSTLQRLQVNGPIYQRIVQNKDVVADVLPPPEYVVESYLVALEIRRARDPAELATLTSEIGKLEREYAERHEFWSKDLDKGALKDLLVTTSSEPAQRFFSAVRNDLLPAQRAGDDAAAEKALSAVQAAYQQHRKAIDEVVKIANVQAATDEASAVRELASGTAWLLGLATCFILLLVAVGLRITLSITRPLQALTVAAAKIALGDVEQTVEHHGDDEVGRLADAFRALIDYIQGVARALDSVRKGDLSFVIKARSERDMLSKNFGSLNETLNALVVETQTLIVAAKSGALSVRGNPATFSSGGFGQLVVGINTMMDTMLAPVQEASTVLEQVAARDLTARMHGDYQGEFARIKRVVNTAADNLHDSLAQVASAADQVSSAAEQISSSSQAVAQGASHQASALEETSASLEQMSVMTSHNAASAKKAKALAATTRTASESGTLAMAQMTIAMGKIRTSSEGTAAIIRDINDIAFQTNLLALNAAVEAARAGDAGRGFAVVAEEVRNLALRSKEAAKKTEALIKDSVQLAQHGENICQQVGANLDEIVGSIGTVSSVVDAIATASEEQARGITQVNQAVSQMDKVIQANAASSEESASSAEELSAQAAELSSLVQQFKLQGASVVAPRSLVRPPAVPTIRRPARDVRSPAKTWNRN